MRAPPTVSPAYTAPSLVHTVPMGPVSQSGASQLANSKLALPSNVRLVPGDTGGCGDTTNAAVGVPDSTFTVWLAVLVRP